MNVVKGAIDGCFSLSEEPMYCRKPNVLVTVFV